LPTEVKQVKVKAKGGKKNSTESQKDTLGWKMGILAVGSAADWRQRHQVPKKMSANIDRYGPSFLGEVARMVMVDVDYLFIYLVGRKWCVENGVKKVSTGQL
jgi:hypothetical protein